MCGFKKTGLFLTNDPVCHDYYIYSSALSNSSTPRQAPPRPHSSTGNPPLLALPCTRHSSAPTPPHPTPIYPTHTPPLPAPDNLMCATPIPPPDRWHSPTTLPRSQPPHTHAQPDNLMWDASGQLKLIDWGCARKLPPLAEAVVLDGPLKGTRGYQAPEMAERAEANLLSDIFRWVGGPLMFTRGGWAPAVHQGW